MENNKKMSFKQGVINFLTGDKKIISDNLSNIYTGAKLDAEIERHKKRMIYCYFAVWLICTILVIAFLIGEVSQKRNITFIDRPERGEGSISVPVEISASYRDTSVNGNTNVYISERRLTKKEVATAIEECARNIMNIVPADKNGTRIVFEDIELPENDEKNGAVIKWTSSDPVLVSEEGKVDVLSLSGQSEKITLTADISLEDIEKRVELELMVVQDPKMYESSISNSVDAMLKKIDSDGKGKSVRLPQKLDNGVKLKWNTKSDKRAAMSAIIGAICFLGIYMRRYSGLRKKVRRYREDVVENFPYIIDKLVLMLNSGLTVFSAMMKISEDGKVRHNTSPLATELTNIGVRVKETNALWLDEWKDFAVRMESSDMLRFISILEDNYKKGGELVEKLEAEGDNMREMRKKNVQQRIRLIDSKMTVPLMLMLTSLVIVSVTPAVMQI